jgi:hypothetical protein
MFVLYFVKLFAECFCSLKVWYNYSESICLWSFLVGRLLIIAFILFNVKGILNYLLHPQLNFSTLSISRNPFVSFNVFLGLVAYTVLKSVLMTFLSIFFFLFNFFLIRYLAHLHFQCYTKSPPYPPTPTPLPAHSPFLALAFPCSGAYKVCVSNGPLFPVMAD